MKERTVKVFIFNTMGCGATKPNINFQGLSSEVSLNQLPPDKQPQDEQFLPKTDEITLILDQQDIPQHNDISEIDTLALPEPNLRDLGINPVPQTINSDFFETSKKEPKSNIDYLDIQPVAGPNMTRQAEEYVIDDALQMSPAYNELTKEASTSPLVSHFLLQTEKKFERSDIFEISSSSESPILSSKPNIPKDISTIPTTNKQFASVGYANFDFNFIDENQRKHSSLPSIKQDKKSINIHEVNQLIEELDL